MNALLAFWVGWGIGLGTGLYWWWESRRWDRLAAAITPCPHEWFDRGEGQDEWRECYLCGKQEDR